jgi:AraC-like DNA-binding protein
MEFGAGLLLHLYRFLTKRQVTPVSVHFVHSRQHGLREVSRYFGCSVSYLQNRSQIVLKASDMKIPIDTSDYRLLNVLTAYCDAVLKEHGTRQAGLLQKVEQRIIDHLPKGAARAEVVTTELGVSERTLTRQVAERRTSFTEILDRLRNDLALKYIRESDLSLAGVAFLLSYANPRAFGPGVQALDW